MGDDQRNTSGATSIRLGELTIDLIEEFSAPVHPRDEFLVGQPPGAAQENQNWMAPQHDDPDTWLMVMADHTWVFRTPDTTVLINTCWGNGKERPGFGANLNTDWLHDLESLGSLLTAAAQEEHVLFSAHFPAPHAGWVEAFGETFAWLPV